MGLVIITIGKIADSITLDYWIYMYSRVYGKDKIRPISQMIKHASEVIEKKTWEVLVAELNDGDFWGLKEDNGNNVLDGSDLIIEGYKRPLNKYTFVHRMCVERMPIGILFKRLMNLSKAKINCLETRF